MTKDNLLPIGFYDLMFEGAKAQFRRINFAVEYFFSKDFNLVKPPLVEFKKNYSDKNETDSFRFNDILSGETLILRKDITRQIERIVKSKFNSDDFPLKICYADDSLISQSSELFADRQLTQIGAEIIGINDFKESTCEILSAILYILPRIIKTKLTIEISIPSFTKDFVNNIEGKFSKKDLLRAIKSKNISEIRKILPQKSEILREIILSNRNSSEIFKSIYQNFFQNSIPSKIEENIIKIHNIENFIEANFPEFELRFNLFGDSKDDYHDDFSFEILAENFSYAIARGGSYKIKDLQACGATIYMNYLRNF